MKKIKATPTFSGGEYPCCNTSHKEGKNCPIHEQKEYCTCNIFFEPGKSVLVEKVNPPICANCHKEIRMGKPIPAEKKECEHIARCIKCDVFLTREPEPKPKDRIEPINENCSKDQLFWNVKHKVEEIIQWINERG